MVQLVLHVLFIFPHDPLQWYRNFKDVYKRMKDSFFTLHLTMRCFLQD